jgi:hypothetical protein
MGGGWDGQSCGWDAQPWGWDGGTNDAPDGEGAAAGCGAPQLPQKASPGSTLSPHTAQRKPPPAGRAGTPANDAPQLSQKAAPAGTCAPQFGQLIILIFYLGKFA